MRPAHHLLLAGLLTLGFAGCSDGTSPDDGLRDVFRQVSVGGSRVCAVVESGRGYCWGQRFDFDGSDSVPTPFAAERTFDGLLAASGLFGNYACGHTGSATVCQGFMVVNVDQGQPLGDVPTELEHDVPMVTLGAGDTHFCGLADGGVAWCWGDLDAGVRGDGQSATDILQPNLVTGDLTFTSIGAGTFHTCGGTADGAMYCWGAGTYLGAPSAAIDSSTDTCYPVASCAHGPVRTELTAAARQLVVGAFASCAITDAAELWCWGDRFDGSPSGGAPARVTIPGGGVAAVALGSEHGCALATDGKAYCYGRNDVGQLGVEPSSGWQTTPVLAADGMRFAALAAGGNTSCGLTSGGALYCWGSNEFGQLGVGNRESGPLPLRVRLPGAS